MSDRSPYRRTRRSTRSSGRCAEWPDGGPYRGSTRGSFPPIDRFVSRITGRKKTFAGLLSGIQVLLLTTTGAKTGTLRTQPINYLRHGEDFVLIASNWGQEHNPGWYYNLRAHPTAMVTLDGATFDVVAREATEPERDLYWPQGTRMYPAWNVYKARSPRRRFPMMVLSRG